MKKAKKVVALLLCAVLLVVGSVTGTMAYLTSQDSVTNTFTIGKVAITLDEAAVNEYGKYVGVTKDTNGNVTDKTDVVYDREQGRVKANDYKLIPGHTYVKDPTIHVKGDSEPAYLRMKVSFNEKVTVDQLGNVFGTENVVDGVFLLQNFVGGWDKELWKIEKYDAATKTYEFRYRDIVAAPAGTAGDAYFDVTPLFKSITVPSTVDNDDLNILTEAFNIQIVAHAIQADGFANADEAWAAFDGQMNSNK